MEDPIRNTCLEPQSLVMTPSECFYCFGKEGDKCYQIFSNFGINSCNAHYAASVRDCNAYLHREKMVYMGDLENMPQLENLFSMLENGFYVPRTGRGLEAGWILNIFHYGEKKYMAYVQDSNSWLIPVKNKELNVMKGITIEELLNTENIALLPENFKDNVACLVDIVNKGVYSEDNKKHEALINRDNQTSVPDIDNIVTVNVGGIVGRVFIQPI